MLLIACPCAVGLSTPTAVSAAIGNSAKRGILVRGGNHLESAAVANVVVFDKTGTLTKGLPEVTQLHSYSKKLSKEDILSLAATAELHSNHPLGGAIVNHAREAQIDFAQSDSFEIIDGCGMRAEWKGHSVLVGNSRLLEKFDIATPPQVAEQHAELMQFGDTLLFVVDQQKLVGLIGVKDNIRAHVASTIDQLRKQGLSRVMVLTGDHRAAAEIVAKAAGIKEWHAELMPEQKYELIRNLQRDGYRVIMVGDGINDAPALAIADVGIAIGTESSDVAIESSDLALASEDFRQLVTTLKISKKTIRVIKQNYGMALGINAGGLAVGAFGLINPFMAIVLHNASTLAVLMNSSKLIGYDPKGKKAKPAKSSGIAAKLFGHASNKHPGKIQGTRPSDTSSKSPVLENNKDLAPA